ncbi:MAG: class I SAM-dependent methyltransferase [Saprospiraceae bacterium]|nr:class I SAM-dependent methyltransferase [Saprospiraceae bacterium]
MIKENHTFSDKCPVCSGQNLQVKDWVLRNNYQLGVCIDCGFKFTQPRPNLNFLIDYYNSISSVRFYKHTNEETLKDTKKLHKAFKKYAPNGKRVLEIGCSTAYYLHGLKLRGYEVVGTELSEDACNLARKWYNVEVYASEYPPKEYLQTFDIIILHHVIEHVIDPRDFLAKACEYLNKDGIVIIETPNVNSMGISVFKQHYPVLCPPGHLNYFSPATLTSILPSNFKSLDVTTINSGNSTIYNSLNAISSFMGVKKSIDDKISKKTEFFSDNNTVVKSNRKFTILRAMFKVSYVIQTIFYPIFYLLEKSNKGENLQLIARKEK